MQKILMVAFVAAVFAATFLGEEKKPNSAPAVAAAVPGPIPLSEPDARVLLRLQRNALQAMNTYLQTQKVFEDVVAETRKKYNCPGCDLNEDPQTGALTLRPAPPPPK